MPKKVKIGIIVSVIIVLSVACYSIYKAQNQTSSFVKEINRNLSPQDRQAYEAQLAQAQDGLLKSQSDSEKYNFLIAQANMFTALGRLNEAKDSFQKASELYSDQDGPFMGGARIAAEAGDNVLAEKLYKQALKVRPTNAENWKQYILFRIDKTNANTETITSLYSEAVVKTNSDVDVLTAYATWLEKIGNLQAAKEYWGKAILSLPKNNAIYEAEIKRIEGLLK